MVSVVQVRHGKQQPSYGVQGAGSWVPQSEPHEIVEVTEPRVGFVGIKQVVPLFQQNGLEIQRLLFFFLGCDFLGGYVWGVVFVD
jgi:hypothetical protein